MAYPGQMNPIGSVPWFVGNQAGQWMTPAQYRGQLQAGISPQVIEESYQKGFAKDTGLPQTFDQWTGGGGSPTGSSFWSAQGGGGGFSAGGAPQGPQFGGGAGGAPQGPYGGFGHGTPSSVAQARQMAFQGTLDPWRNFYANSPGFQNVLQREQDIGMGRDQLNYDPLRAEASDQAAAAARSSRMGLESGMAGRGLRASPGAMNAAMAPVRRDLGTAYRRIGFQESQDNMSRQDAARARVSGMWGQQQQNVSQSALARLGELGKMQEVSGGGGTWNAAGGGSPAARGLMGGFGMSPYQSNWAASGGNNNNMFDQYFGAMARAQERGFNWGGGNNDGSDATLSFNDDDDD